MLPVPRQSRSRKPLRGASCPLSDLKPDRANVGQPSPSEHLTTKQAARALGVSEASVKRWCDKGILDSARTPGGHRRLSFSSLVEYLRRSEQQLADPEILGLPRSRQELTASGKVSQDQFRDWFVEGEVELPRAAIVAAYLAGRTVVDILEEFLVPSIQELGELWECGDVAVYQERRACEIAFRLLQDLDRLLPAPAADAPLAIGGTLSGDPYVLPSALVALALREGGWRSRALGVNLPAYTLCEALDVEQPDLFWLSVSSVEDAATFLDAYATVHDRAAALEVPVVVGGRELTPELRRAMRYSAFCDNLRHLETFAQTLLVQGEGDGGQHAE